MRYRAVLAAGASLLAVGPFTLLDTDLGHDGYVLAAALAVLDGAVPHRDVFRQYGPVLPVVHAVGAMLTPSPLIGIRLLSLALLVVTAALAASCGSDDRRWPISHGAAVTGALAWVLLSDQPFMSIPFHPWVSTLMALVLVTGLLATKRAVLATTLERRGRFAMVAGGTVGLLLFIRPQAFAVALLAMGAVALPGGTGTAAAIARRLLAGAALAVAVGCSLLAAGGTVGHWFAQAIRFPFGIFVVEQPQFEGSGGLLTAAATWGRPAAAAILACAALIALLRSGRAPDRGSDSRARVLTAAWLGICGTVSVHALVGIGPAMDGIIAFLLGVDRGGGRAAAMAALGAALVAGVIAIVRATDVRSFLQRRPIAAAAILAIPIALQVLRTTDVRLLASTAGALVAAGILLSCTFGRTPIAPGLALLAPFAAAGFSEALSTGSSRHFWSSLPLALLLMLAVLRSLGAAGRPVAVALAGVVLLAGVGGLRAGADSLREGRPQLEAVGPASGLYGLHDRPGTTSPEVLAAEVLLLEEHLGPEGTAVLLIDDGFYAVATGRFASADPWFVRWGPAPPLSERLPTTDLVISDGEDCPECSALVDAGWTVADRAGRLVAWRVDPHGLPS